MGQQWARVFPGTADWSQRAYQKFVAALSEETRRFIADRGDEATVVVFGPTQVGKTTLILGLLGVLPTQMLHVGALLRGGRSVGRSATPTAMQYTRSPDDYWHVSLDGNDSRLDDDGLVAALADLRRRVEAGEWTRTAAVQIRIPAKYLVPGGADRPSIRVIDLPGDNPANEWEAAHVRTLSRRYVQLADLVLLVTRADNLGFFGANGLGDANIQGWRYMPARYRLITTYTFSPETMVGWVRRQLDVGELSLATLRRLVAEEILTFDSTLDVELLSSAILCPVEIGNSWVSFVEQHPDLGAVLEPMMATMWRQLLADIAAAADPLSRIRHARDTHLTARRLRDALRQTCRAEKARRRIVVEKLTRQHMVALSFLERAEMALQSCRQIPTKSNSVDVRISAIQSIPPGTPGKSRKAFQNAIADFSGDLLAKVRKASETLSNDTTFVGRNPFEGQAEVVRDLLHDAFHQLRAKLDGYWIDRYVPGVSDGYATDVKLYKSACRTAADAVCGRIQSAWDVEVRRLESEARALESKLTSRRNAVARLADARRSRLDGAIVDMQEYRRRVARTVRDLGADIRLGLIFKERIDAVCREELRRRRQIIATETRPVARLLHLLGAVSVCDQRRKLVMD